MAQPHILIPIHDFNAGGTEVIAFRLAQLWLEAGWRVTILTGDEAGSMRDRAPPGAAVKAISPPVPRSAISRLRLGKAMAPFAAAEAPDIVFIPGNFHWILAHALKRAMPGAAIVAKISNPMLPPGIAGRVLALAGAPLLRRYFAPIDEVVAMTAGLAEEHRRLAPWQSVHAILDPNVPDSAAVRPMRDRRGSPELGPGPARLLLIGRLEPQKDIPLALDVLATLLRRRPAHLTILGEGYLRPALERQAGRMGLTGHIALPGFVDDVGAAMDAADLMLITSRYEGGPAVAVEALARGLPLVSTDCSHFLRGLVTDPRLGRLVPGHNAAALADAVEAQLASEPAPLALAEQAVEPSRYGAAAAAYLAVFAGAIGRRSA